MPSKKRNYLKIRQAVFAIIEPLEQRWLLTQCLSLDANSVLEVDGNNTDR